MFINCVFDEYSKPIRDYGGITGEVQLYSEAIAG